MRNAFTFFFIAASILGRPSLGFVPQSGVMSDRTATFTLKLSKDVESIANELQELEGGKKNKRQSLPVDDHKGEGFNTYHESLVHNLRKELWEKDKQLHDTLNELENAMFSSATAFEIAEVTEQSYLKEHQLYQEEHESVRRLLWQATKLIGRRIKNGALWILRFGRKPSKTSK